MNDIKKLTYLKVIIFISCILISVVSTIYIVFNIFNFKQNIEILDEKKLNEIVSKHGCTGVSGYEGDIRVSYSFYTDDSCPFFLSYMVVNDEDYLEFVYYLYEAEIEKNGGSTSRTSIDLEKFQYYEVESNGTYNLRVVSYNGTLLVVSTSLGEEVLFNDLIVDTGYYYEINIEYICYLIIPILVFFLGIFSISYINKRGIKSKYYGM